MSKATVIREILDRSDWGDGQVVIGSINMELIERCIHAMDQTFLPSRPDSSVDPCPHRCEYCLHNDQPS